MLLERPVKIVARKKIVLIIVEGPTDEDSLGLFYNYYFNSDNQEIRIEVMHGDITTDLKKYPGENIREKITKRIKANNKLPTFKSADYSQIIHIVDTDGVFIDEQFVFEQPDATEFQYSLSGIRYKEREKVISRNIQKAENIKKMLDIKYICKTIPYSVYFMSCNLEHVLHNELNLSEDEKERKAHEFAKRYKDKFEEFFDFISKSDFSVDGNYKESWEFIQKDLNSLNRNSNLHLSFKKYE